MMKGSREGSDKGKGKAKARAPTEKGYTCKRCSSTIPEEDLESHFLEHAVEDHQEEIDPTYTHSNSSSSDESSDCEDRMKKAKNLKQHISAQEEMIIYLKLELAKFREQQSESSEQAVAPPDQSSGQAGAPPSKLKINETTSSKKTFQKWVDVGPGEPTISLSVSPGPDSSDDILDSDTTEHKKPKTDVKHRRKTKKNPRRKQRARRPEAKTKQCPKCDNEYINLKRHLRDIHEVPEETATWMSRSKPEDDDKEQYSVCPIEKCPIEVKHIPSHLMKYHKLTNPSKEYDQAMANFYRYRDAKRLRLDVIPREEVLVLDSPGSPGTDSCEEVASSHSADVNDKVDDNPEAHQSSVRNTMKGLRSRKSHIECDAPVSPSAQAILSDFENWCCSIDGEGKQLKNVKQHVRQVQKIWGISSRIYSLDDLLNPSTVRDAFVNPVFQGTIVQSGTLASYLASLAMFLRFLISVNTFDHRRIITMQAAVKSWSRVAGKAKRKRLNATKQLDVEEEITAEDAEILDKCKISRQAAHDLNAAEDDPDVTTYNRAMAFLITQLMLANAQRSGAMTNMTIKEVKNAKRATDGKEEYYTIVVVEHKTDYIGPVTLTVTATIYNHLMSFLRAFRMPVGATATGRVVSESETLFAVHGTGSSLTSSRLNEIINWAYERYLKRHINTTQFRKTMVTEVLDQRPDLSGILGQQMSHSMGTQNRHYQLALQMKRGVEIASVMSQAIRKKCRSDLSTPSPRRRLNDNQIEDQIFPQNLSPMSAPASVGKSDSRISPRGSKSSPRRGVSRFAKRLQSRARDLSASLKKRRSTDREQRVGTQTKDQASQQNLTNKTKVITPVTEQGTGNQDEHSTMRTNAAPTTQIANPASAAKSILAKLPTSMNSSHRGDISPITLRLRKRARALSAVLKQRRSSQNVNEKPKNSKSLTPTDPATCSMDEVGTASATQSPIVNKSRQETTPNKSSSQSNLSNTSLWDTDMLARPMSLKPKRVAKKLIMDTEDNLVGNNKSLPREVSLPLARCLNTVLPTELANYADSPTPTTPAPYNMDEAGTTSVPQSPSCNKSQKETQKRVGKQTEDQTFQQNLTTKSKATTPIIGQETCNQDERNVMRDNAASTTFIADPASAAKSNTKKSKYHGDISPLALRLRLRARTLSASLEQRRSSQNLNEKPKYAKSRTSTDPATCNINEATTTSAAQSASCNTSHQETTPNKSPSRSNLPNRSIWDTDMLARLMSSKAKRVAKKLRMDSEDNQVGNRNSPTRENARRLKTVSTKELANFVKSLTPTTPGKCHTDEARTTCVAQSPSCNKSHQEIQQRSQQKLSNKAKTISSATEQDTCNQDKRQAMRINASTTLLPDPASTAKCKSTKVPTSFKSSFRGDISPIKLRLRNRARALSASLKQKRSSQTLCKKPRDAKSPTPTDQATCIIDETGTTSLAQSPSSNKSNQDTQQSVGNPMKEQTSNQSLTEKVNITPTTEKETGNPDERNDMTTDAETITLFPDPASTAKSNSTKAPTSFKSSLHRDISPIKLRLRERTRALSASLKQKRSSQKLCKKPRDAKSPTPTDQATCNIDEAGTTSLAQSPSSNKSNQDIQQSVRNLMEEQTSQHSLTEKANITPTTEQETGNPNERNDMTTDAETITLFPHPASTEKSNSTKAPTSFKSSLHRDISPIKLRLRNRARALSASLKQKRSSQNLRKKPRDAKSPTPTDQATCIIDETGTTSLAQSPSSSKSNQDTQESVGNLMEEQTSHQSLTEKVNITPTTEQETGNPDKRNDMTTDAETITLFPDPASTAKSNSTKAPTSFKSSLRIDISPIKLCLRKRAWVLSAGLKQKRSSQNVCKKPKDAKYLTPTDQATCSIDEAGTTSLALLPSSNRSEQETQQSVGNLMEEQTSQQNLTEKANIRTTTEKETGNPDECNATRTKAETITLFPDPASAAKSNTTKVPKRIKSSHHSDILPIALHRRLRARALSASLKQRRSSENLKKRPKDAKSLTPTDSATCSIDETGTTSVSQLSNRNRSQQETQQIVGNQTKDPISLQNLTNEAKTITPATVQETCYQDELNLVRTKADKTTVILDLESAAKSKSPNLQTSIKSSHRRHISPIALRRKPRARAKNNKYLTPTHPVTCIMDEAGTTFVTQSTSCNKSQQETQQNVGNHMEVQTFQQNLTKNAKTISATTEQQTCNPEERNAISKKAEAIALIPDPESTAKSNPTSFKSSHHRDISPTAVHRRLRARAHSTCLKQRRSSQNLKKKPKDSKSWTATCNMDEAGTISGSQPPNNNRSQQETQQKVGNQTEDQRSVQNLTNRAKTITPATEQENQDECNVVRTKAAATTLIPDTASAAKSNSRNLPTSVTSFHAGNISPIALRLRKRARAISAGLGQRRCSKNLNVKPNMPNL